MLLGIRAQRGRRATLVCAGYGHTSSATALLLLRLRRRLVRELERRGDIAPEAPDDVRREDEPKAGGVALIRNSGIQTDIRAVIMAYGISSGACTISRQRNIPSTSLHHGTTTSTGRGGPLTRSG